MVTISSRKLFLIILILFSIVLFAGVNFQGNWRWYEDDDEPSSSTAHAAENTSATFTAPGENLQLRFEVYDPNSNASVDDLKLFYSVKPEGMFPFYDWIEITDYPNNAFMWNETSNISNSSTNTTFRLTQSGSSNEKVYVYDNASTFTPLSTNGLRYELVSNIIPTNVADPDEDYVFEWRFESFSSLAGGSSASAELHFSLYTSTFSGSWTQLSVPSGPGSKGGIGVASFNEGENVLVFGGHSGSSVQGDTYIFNGQSASWTLYQPPTEPSRRVSPYMTQINDTQAILFGGDVNSSFDDPDDETWRFDISSGSWTQLNPSTSPSVRFAGQMAGVGTNDAIIFGGIDGNGDRIDETWLWDNSANNWVELNPPSSPSGRHSFALCQIDEDEILLFGGSTTLTDDDDDLIYSNETWIWNNTSGSWNRIWSTEAPSGRTSAMMQKISDDEIILFGGETDGDTNNDETWVYTISAQEWTQLNNLPSSPTARRSSAFGVSYNNSILLFGGTTGGNVNETWIFRNFYSGPIANSFSSTFYSDTEIGLGVNISDGNSGSATLSFAYGTSSGNYSSTSSEIEFSGTSDESLTLTGLTSDQKYFVIAQGSNTTTNTESFEDVFFTTSEPISHAASFGINSISDSPGFSLTFSAASSISSSGYIVLYKEGSSITGLPSDFTAYSTGNNIGDATVGGIITDNNATSFAISLPSPDTEYELKLIPFNYVNSELISSNFYTGGSIPTTSGSTGSEYGSWSSLNPPSPPVGRNLAQIASISDNEVLMFGGEDDDDGENNNSYIYNISTNEWTQIYPSTSPAKRKAYSLDRVNGRNVILFGGYDEDNSIQYGDTWVFNPSSNEWTNRNPSNSPASRRAHMTASISNDEILLFGGYDDSDDLNDTWKYSYSANSWTQITTSSTYPLERRNGVMAKLNDNEVLLVGGKTDDEDYENDTWIFNTSTNQWSEITSSSTYPKERRIFGAAQLEENVVLIHSGRMSGTELMDSWIFDRNTNEWTYLDLTTSNTFEYAFGMTELGEKSGRALAYGGKNDDTSYEEGIWLFQKTNSNPYFSDFLGA